MLPTSNIGISSLPPSRETPPPPPRKSAPPTKYTPIVSQDQIRPAMLSEDAFESIGEDEVREEVDTREETLEPSFLKKALDGIIDLFKQFISFISCNRCENQEMEDRSQSQLDKVDSSNISYIEPSYINPTSDTELPGIDEQSLPHISLVSGSIVAPENPQPIPALNNAQKDFVNNQIDTIFTIIENTTFWNALSSKDQIFVTIDNLSDATNSGGVLENINSLTLITHIIGAYKGKAQEYYNKTSVQMLIPILIKVRKERIQERVRDGMKENSQFLMLIAQACGIPAANRKAWERLVLQGNYPSAIEQALA